MNAFQQLHVGRRILPILAKLPDMFGLTLEEIMAAPEEIVASLMSNLDKINLDVIASTFAELDQGDVDYIINACLDSAQIKDPKGTGWGRLRKNGVVMYDHLGMREMLGVAINVIKDNLGDFFGENAPTWSGAEDGETTEE
jgi:hypothetical protein